jgi:hypothetical protein
MAFENALLENFNRRPVNRFHGSCETNFISPESYEQFIIKFVTDYLELYSKIHLILADISAIKVIFLENIVRERTEYLITVYSSSE